MSNSVQQKITINLEKAKAEGKIRSEHVRVIVKDAVVESFTELKEGAGEIRSIIQDAISTIIADLKGDDNEPIEKISASIEGAIEGITDQRQQAIDQKRTKLLEIQTLLDQQQQEIDREITGILIDIKATKSIDSKDSNSEAISSAVNTVQERQESGILQEQYLKLKLQLASFDQKLAMRYGERYVEIKQQLEKQFEKAKIWYDQKKTEADSSGTIPLQQKQIEIESNFGEFGSMVARKEQEVKQRLQELWGKSVNSDFF